ncbi:MAG: FAD pyrophosphatase (EC [uncultured Thiotrichaceae bacterium]|uniref:FAD pyrophosphatase (EC) n=1 Tax=uncultured Thiotrichaceae bacterium TaxID=298394 RepID=A0A6S6UAL7_9GAMM|nr:MAG: FAD pyrophosphatase (EC [uncultured Thiotrichaceae bacterium]
MKYCSGCGEEVVVKVPEGDNRSRFVCESCDTIHYQNPRIIAGAIPVHEDKVLLCKRAIHPRRGFWTLPAGFMENEETIEQAAQRETFEEAQATIENLQLYTVMSLPHISQVYMLFRSEMVDGIFAPGEESLETQLFDEKDIPWEEIAFPTMSRTLKYFFQDRSEGAFQMRNVSLFLQKKLR